MKRFQLIKRSTSFLLAVTLLFAQPIGTFAQERADSESSQSVNSSLESNTSTGNTSLGNTSTSNTSTDTSNNSKQTTETKNETEITKETSKTGSQKKTEAKESAETSDSINEEDDSSSITDEDKNAKKETEENEETDTDKEVIEDKEKSSKEADSNDDEYDYKSNEDGTHVKIHKETKEEITEDCEFDENGICIHCGYEKEPKEETSNEEQTFEVQVGEFKITAKVPAGAFDEEVEFKADKIELSADEKQLTNSVTKEEYLADYYAFDLRFVYGEDDTEIEPKEGYNVKISIESEKIESDEIVHISDEKSVEVMDSIKTDSTVEFETESFSTYVLTIPDDVKTNSSKVYFENTAYGSAYSDYEYSAIKDIKAVTRASTKSEWSFWYGSVKKSITYDDPKFAVQIKRDGLSFPNFPEQNYNNTNCYVIKTDKNSRPNTFKFYFDAPENYYIAKIRLLKNNWYEIDSKSYSQNGTYETSVEYDAKLLEALDGAYNTIAVDLQPLPTVLTNKTTVVSNATFVNYENYNHAFGSQFIFNNGGSGSESNICHYGQVYQGLAKNELTSNGEFELAYSNDNPLFPEYSQKNKYSYITDYYNNVGVTFTKDTDGYWNIDSSQYKYVYDSTNNKVVPVSGNQFRPFPNNDNHFGMILPINFSVDKNGTTNGKDTVFKFFGDDDVFVYVDGKLVLDLGGIHNAVNGQINFKTGEVLIHGHASGNPGELLTSSLDDTAYANKAIGTTNLYDIIAENNVEELSQKEHVLTVVYFERGANLSNCKISFNFTKNETRNIEYKGFKLDENGNGLAGAKFKLYTDEACTSVAKIGNGQEAETVSKEDGTISFENLSAGVIPDELEEVSRVYYMKETEAPEGFVTPENALWKLTLTAKSDGSYTTSLIAVNDEAQHLSLDNKKIQILDAETSVLFIKNEKTRTEKTLNVTKHVSDGTGVNPDESGRYKFIIKKDIDNVQTPLANQAYKIGDVEYTTDNNGYFWLKAEETAIFENLYDSKYIVAEVGVESDKYNLSSYTTRIVVDGNEDDYLFYTSSSEAAREVTIDFVTGQDERGFDVCAAEKSVEYFNQITYSLPETGGNGIFMYTIGGVLLMIGAALLLYKTKRTI